MDFGWVWGGSWEGFGRGLEALGVSWVTFWRHFLKLVFRTLSKRALGGFWVPFGLHFEGSGKGLGRILGGFWNNLEDQKLNFPDRVFRFRVLVKGFGPRTRCLKISYVA